MALDQKEIEALIARAIDKTKLDQSEKRLDQSYKLVNFLIFFVAVVVAIFGIAVPLYQSSQQTDKVEKAIAELKETSKESKEDIGKSLQEFKEDFNSFKIEQETRVNKSLQEMADARSQMKKDFDELSGLQLRKPNIECFYKSGPLEGSIIALKGSELYPSIVIKNNGDAPARNIHLKIYFKPENRVSYLHDLGGVLANRIQTSDEPGYDCCYETEGMWLLDPGEHKSLTLSYEDFSGKHFNVLMKVFYEQPQPKGYTFIIDAAQNN